MAAPAGVAAGGEGAGGGVTPSAVSKSISWSGRGRSPFHTRAAVPVSGWPSMLTRAMSPLSAGRGSRITPGGGPAMADTNWAKDPFPALILMPTSGVVRDELRGDLLSAEPDPSPGRPRRPAVQRMRPFEGAVDRFDGR